MQPSLSEWESPWLSIRVECYCQCQNPEHPKGSLSFLYSANHKDIRSLKKKSLWIDSEMNLINFQCLYRLLICSEINLCWKHRCDPSCKHRMNSRKYHTKSTKDARGGKRERRCQQPPPVHALCQLLLQHCCSHFSWSLPNSLSLPAWMKSHPEAMGRRSLSPGVNHRAACPLTSFSRESSFLSYARLNSS